MRLLFNNIRSGTPPAKRGFNRSELHSTGEPTVAYSSSTSPRRAPSNLSTLGGMSFSFRRRPGIPTTSPSSYWATKSTWSPERYIYMFLFVIFFFWNKLARWLTGSTVVYTLVMYSRVARHETPVTKELKHSTDVISRLIPYMRSFIFIAGVEQKGAAMVPVEEQYTVLWDQCKGGDQCWTGVPDDS